MSRNFLLPFVGGLVTAFAIINCSSFSSMEIADPAQETEAGDTSAPDVLEIPDSQLLEADAPDASLDSAVISDSNKPDVTKPDSAIEAGEGGTCPPGLANCSGFCVNLVSDKANCGGCSKVCDAGKTCSGGSCL